MDSDIDDLSDDEIRQRLLQRGTLTEGRIEDLIKHRDQWGAVQAIKWELEK